MNVHPREALNTRDATKNLAAYLDRLKQGDLSKVVIVRGPAGREAVGVILTPDRFDELVKAAGRVQ